MVFHAGLRCTRDVARLSESVKILEPQANLHFPKVEQHRMDHAILLGKPFGNCFIK